MQIKIIMRGTKMDNLEQEVREIQMLMEMIFGLETDLGEEDPED